MRVSKKTVLLIILTYLLCVACNNVKPLFEETIAIDSGIWNKDNIVSITIPVEDSLQNYDLQIYLRNRGDYPYSNIYLFVSVTAPTGAMVTDTIQYVLADGHGKWKGKGFSQLWDNRLFFRKNVRFAAKGNYLLQIRQGMREDELIGITDVGIRLLESGNAY